MNGVSCLYFAGWREKHVYGGAFKIPIELIRNYDFSRYNSVGSTASSSMFILQQSMTVYLYVFVFVFEFVVLF